MTHDLDPPRDDDILVIRNWPDFLPYVRLSRDRMRSRLPQVSLNVAEMELATEDMTLAERGAYLTVLLAAASRPLHASAKDALGPRQITRKSILRSLSAGNAHGKRMLASLLERDLMAFCRANDGRLASRVELSRVEQTRAEQTRVETPNGKIKEEEYDDSWIPLDYRGVPSSEERRASEIDRMFGDRDD